MPRIPALAQRSSEAKSEGFGNKRKSALRPQSRCVCRQVTVLTGQESSRRQSSDACQHLGTDGGIQVAQS